MRIISVLDHAKLAYENGMFDGCLESLSKLPENTLEDKLLIWANTYFVHLAKGDFELAARYAKRVNDHDATFFERIGEKAIIYISERKRPEVLTEKEIDELLSSLNV